MYFDGSAPSHLKDLEITEDLKIIPKGATYRIQPIDVVIGKSYKDLVREQFNKFFEENHNILTKTGIIKKPTKDNILKMHSLSFKALGTDKILTAFRVTGFTLNLDGSESYLLTKKLVDLNTEEVNNYLDLALNNKENLENYAWINDIYSFKEESEENIEFEQSKFINPFVNEFSV